MKSFNYVIVALLVLVIENALCIMFNLEPNGRKCLRGEIQAHILQQGEIEVSEVPGQTVSYEVKDSKGHIFTRDEVPHGKSWKFTFTSETFDTYEICIYSSVPTHQRGAKQEVTLSIKHGVETKNYEAIAEAAKLKPIEVELKRLEDLSASIVQDFVRMRQNEEQMRDTNEATNARVLYFSIFSMCCLLGLATWQVFYLRRFFRAKKLIE
ncbi:hypothetical protein PV328_002485 [Microctonus aethiopoides]|uniref:GOLD domain-containing protein n=1 Tax=Microctonus aethiopoides TaxID=144406 RepID=A0AA39F6D4_9HYME|nr:hypothetical protein PV328_002485 [Microctonus aethiopoides]